MRKETNCRTNNIEGREKERKRGRGKGGGEGHAKRQKRHDEVQRYILWLLFNLRRKEKVRGEGKKGERKKSWMPDPNGHVSIIDLDRREEKGRERGEAGGGG